MDILLKLRIVSGKCVDYVLKDKIINKTLLIVERKINFISVLKMGFIMLDFSFSIYYNKCRDIILLRR